MLEKDCIIRKSTVKDIDRLMEIFAMARSSIKAYGIDQWQDGYPQKELILEDIKKGISYSLVCGQENIIVGTAVIFIGKEPDYNEIFEGSWIRNSEKYGVIHRIASAQDFKNKGTASSFIQYAVDLCKKNNVHSIRIDTHEGNIAMRSFLSKHDFKKCGTIYLKSGAARIAYEKILNFKV